jgi:ABC-2 type transport system permease protein
VARDWRGLWALAIIYFALAVISAFLVSRRRVHG